MTTLINHTLAIEQIKKSIKDGFPTNSCQIIHNNSCEVLAGQFFIRHIKNSYQIYATVYTIQALLRFRTIVKSPLKQLLQVLVSFTKSILFTAIQIMVMRRVLCFLNNGLSAVAPNLIPANFIGALALLIESPGRQCEIALYALNKSIELSYNMGLRRKYYRSLPYGTSVLMGLCIGLICYYRENNMCELRKNYVKHILDYLLDCV